MTRQEVVNFLASNYDIRKKDMTTIKEMIFEAKCVGYDVIKKGVDNYEIYENCAIRDFRKPLVIHREIPEDKKDLCYNDVPIIELWATTLMKTREFDINVYYDLMVNKKDGDKLVIEDDNSVKSYDFMQALGYLRETEDTIEAYACSLDCGYKDIPYKYRNGDLKRLTPIIK